MFWILMKRMLKEWREAVHFVKPDTVVRWHRKGFKYYWRKKSRSKPGRPPISWELIHLIRRMSMENTGWGAPKIASELALLGHDGVRRRRGRGTLRRRLVLVRLRLRRQLPRQVGLSR